MSTALIGGALGFFPENVYVDLQNNTGTARSDGDIVMLNLKQADSTLTISDNKLGATTSGLASFVAPTTAGLDYAIFGVVDTPDGAGIADGKTGRVCLRGITRPTYGATVGVGTPIVAANGVYTAADGDVANVSAKFIGLALDAGSSANRSRTLFDGINGFGVHEEHS